MAPTVPPALRKLARLWEIPFLALLAWMMLRVRMLPYDKLVQDGRAYYIGTDPFYHFREILGGVRAWPAMPRFDPFTHYPYGTGTGQFGSLFDWVASTYIFLVHGRDASETTVHEVVAAYPAVLGALLIVPFYFLAKRLLGTPGGVVATLTLAVLPGEFLIRSVAGYSDHHVAEALTAIVAILGFYVAFEKTRGLRASWTAWSAPDNRRILGWGALAGVTLWINYLTWPPGLLFAAILTVWLILVALSEGARGHDMRATALTGAVGLVTASLLMIPFVESTFLGEFNNYSILHVLGGFAMAAVLVGAERASRVGEDRTKAAWTTFGGLAAMGIGGLVILSVVSPGVYGSLRWGLSWVTGIGVPRTTLTISEARPAAVFCSADTSEYSCLGNDFGIVAPVAGLILIAVLVFAAARRRPADVLLALWSLMIFQATRTQIRFSYYLALNMALLVGWLGARVAEGAGFGRATDDDAGATAGAARGTKGRRVKSPRPVERSTIPWRASVAALALLLVLPGNVFATERSMPGWETADRGFSGPDGDILMWTEALEWLRNNTPDAGVDLGRIVEAPPQGQHYEQAEGSYGVLSWWDYGHWTEVIARRAPVANPFQQAAPFASCYFTEQDPARAEAMLRMWSSYEWRRADNEPCSELEIPSLDEIPLPEENPVRYVVIDDEMAAGKFGAITVWAGCDECLYVNRSLPDQQFQSRESYYDALFKFWRTYRETGGQEHRLPWSGEPYHDTMLSRLYFDDADQLGNYRLVYETPYGVRMGWVAGFGDGGFYSHNQNDFLSGRTSWSPSEWSFRSGDLMYPTGDNRFVYDARVVASVKTYERVEGATIVGAGAEPGSEVVVRVPLKSFTTDREFTWTGRATAAADGTFEVQVPYATTAYLTPEEGGTNVAVRALDAAMIESAGRSTKVHVPDVAVLEGQTVRVSLT